MSNSSATFQKAGFLSLFLLFKLLTVYISVYPPFVNMQFSTLTLVALLVASLGTAQPVAVQGNGLLAELRGLAGAHAKAAHLEQESAALKASAAKLNTRALGPGVLDELLAKGAAVGKADDAEAGAGAGGLAAKIEARIKDIVAKIKAAAAAEKAKKAEAETVA